MSAVGANATTEWKDLCIFVHEFDDTMHVWHSRTGCASCFGLYQGTGFSRARNRQVTGFSHCDFRSCLCRPYGA